MWSMQFIYRPYDLGLVISLLGPAAPFLESIDYDVICTTELEEPNDNVTT